MRIIGVAGQMQAGKDSISDRLKISLEDTTVDKWDRFSFATPLKKIYCDSFNVDPQFIEQWKTKDEYPPEMEKTVRQGLQFIGDGFREIMPRIWINKAFKQIENSENQNFIISDVRYLNEARKIKEVGGLVILIWRKDRENQNPNRSEQEVKPTVDWCRDLNREGWIKDFGEGGPEESNLFDLFIRNEGTLDELYEKVDSWLTEKVGIHFYDNNQRCCF